MLARGLHGERFAVFSEVGGRVVRISVESGSEVFELGEVLAHALFDGFGEVDVVDGPAEAGGVGIEGVGVSVADDVGAGFAGPG